MALSDPWGHDGKTYDGKEMRALVAALTNGRNGVTPDSTSLKAAQQTSPGLTVKVAAGSAVIPATGAGLFGSYQVFNDADLTSPTFTATGGSVRTDRLVLRVTAGVAALEIIAGTAGSASPPAITGDNVTPICQVVFPVSTSAITNAMIVDERGVVPLDGPWKCTSTTRPAVPFEGLDIYETDTNDFRFWDGSAWQRMTPLNGHTTGTTNGSGELAVSFGETFPSAPSVVATADTYMTLRVVTVTTTGFTVHADDEAGGAMASASIEFRWLAL